VALPVALPVSTPEGSYNIVIEPGLLARLGTDAEKYHLKGRVAVVTNTTIAPLYGEALQRALPDAALVTIPDGERFKTLETVRQLYDDFVRLGLDRSSTVIALGGGVVGDTAGFAAATYMRGLRLVQIPTTLLAMVDSSAGGKVGVDLPQGKNLVGAFKQPEVVLIDPEVLKTLPTRERRCGLAEAIKHGLIADEDLLDKIAALPQSLNGQTDAVAYARLVRQAVQVKINLVEEDPYEQSVRAFLNLGHTFAHAIEQVSGYAWLHGEAVGVGLVAAARLSQRLGLCDAALVARVEGAVSAAGLPLHIGDMDIEAIYAAMATDKKWRGGHSRFVLLEGMGSPTLVQDVEKSMVLAVLESLE
jgi:3-dehydroquinate synthase